MGDRSCKDCLAGFGSPPVPFDPVSSATLFDFGHVVPMKEFEHLIQNIIRLWNEVAHDYSKPLWNLYITPDRQ